MRAYRRMVAVSRPNTQTKADRMWCRTCQQDVPAVSSSAEGAVVCCARCGEPFEPVAGSYLSALETDLVSWRAHSEPGGAAESEGIDRSNRPPTAAEAASPAGETAPAGTSDELYAAEIDAWADDPLVVGTELIDWELEEDLRRIERVVQRFRQSRQQADRMDADRSPSIPPWHVHRLQRRQRTGARVVQVMSWASVAIGLAGFVCGGVLAFVATWQQREALWPVAIPSLIVGQLLLLLGLVGLYDLLWRQRGIDDRGSTGDSGEAIVRTEPAHAGPRDPGATRRPSDRRSAGWG